MDLPYPSMKDDQLAIHLGPFDRRRSLIIKDSMKYIQNGPPLTRALKDKIISLIQQDLPYELNQLLIKQVVNNWAEIGRQGCNQTLLHIICRQNSPKCLSFIAKNTYQTLPEDYLPYINNQTKQGITPIMICSLSHSNQCLSLLLKYGGVDIHAIDTNKLSAYQMALNCKNQEAVKMLMEYENYSKKGRGVDKGLNVALLKQKIELEPGKVGWCESIYRCMLDCVTCGGFGGLEDAKKSRKKIASKLGSGRIEGFFIDQVDLGYTQEELGGEEIQWRLMGQFQLRGKTGILFDNYSPFDMEDISHSMPTFLIVFQSLSQHTSLLRRLIQQSPKSGNYTIHLFEKHLPKVINVDSYLPFYSKTNQPLFISDKKQGWPMILQKSFAKLYGTYSKISTLTAADIIENVTGWPVIQLGMARSMVYDQIKRFFLKDKYMFVLQGKANSLLSPKDGSVSCFTVLNFYEKSGKRMVLVNCPFVDPAWMEKERHQILALKILRGHFNCRNQMTIWIQQQRLEQYFGKIIVSPLHSGYIRQHFLAEITQQYIYFKIELQQLMEPVVLYLVDAEKGKLVAVKEWEGWRNEKENVTMGYQFSQQGISKFQGKEGEYLFKAKAQRGKYYIVVWSEEQVKVEPMEESFGQLEWIGCIKKELSFKWPVNQVFTIKQWFGFTIIMVKSENQLSGKWVSFKTKGTVQILEGRRGEGGAVEMINYKDFGYIIFKGCIQGEPTFYQS